MGTDAGKNVWCMAAISLLSVLRGFAFLLLSVLRGVAPAVLAGRLSWLLVLPVLFL